MNLRLPVRGSGAPSSPYDQLGLRDLPFPMDPVVNPYSHDPRTNGTIFATEPVKAEIEKFERLLIRPNDFRNRAKLAYLWSKGDQESGRGMGKTALLRYFRQRINQDWGYTEFNGAFSAAVVYVSFPTQIDRRYMEQLALSALIDICRGQLLDAGRASLRMQALTEEQVEAVTLGPDGVPNPANLLRDENLAARGISVKQLDGKIKETLTNLGVQSSVASALAAGNFENFLKSLRRDCSLEPMYVPRDTKILEYSRGLLFNDIVYFLRAAGFEGGYLFIDDIENLVDQMTRKHRIEFAKEFGLCTVRPGYANTAFNFFSCVLTTHQQASIGLAQAWGDAGLSAIARLDPNSPNSIELPLPSKVEAEDIIKAHLDHYRRDSAKSGSIEPFTRDGLDALLSDRGMLHPRAMLSRAARIVAYAAENRLTCIDSAAVSAAMRSVGSNSAREFGEGIDDAL